VSSARLTQTTALLLRALRQGHRYGFEMMASTGLPGGTLYPALRRMEAAGLVESRWEENRRAAAALRPARRYYRLTRLGERTLAEASERYPILDLPG
jgi:DNA-binding PadR family transcriptional regulator